MDFRTLGLKFWRMIKSKTVLWELFFLSLLFVLCLAGTWAAVQYVFQSAGLPDIRISGEIIEFPVHEIAAVIFIPLAALIWGLRFLFLRSKNIFCGILAIGLMLAMHLLVYRYEPVYIQVRLLTSSPQTLALPPLMTDEDDWPTIEELDARSEVLQEDYDRYYMGIEREVLWIQLGLLVVTLILTVILLFSIRKVNKNKSLSY